MRYNKLLISILATTCILSTPANANVGTGMQSWFDSMGGYTNTTPPSSYKGQTMNGYSAGGFYQRSPVKNYQLAQMTPPSLNIGCGGIDLTAGSFSFINKATITALFQNIGTSIGYAFLLAIKSSMPEMASLFEYLQDVANKVNGMNVNSCKMTEGIPFVQGADLSKNLSAMFSHIAGETANIFPDSFGSWEQTKANALKRKLAKDAAIAADPSKKEQYEPGNVVWRALSKTTGLDNQDKLLIMSMTGTIIIDPPDGTKNTANGGVNAGWHYVEPTGVSIDDFIGYNDNVAKPITLLVCDTVLDCLKPTTPVGGVAVTPFIELIATKLDSMRNNLTGRSTQTLSDFYLVDASAIPVWKMISTTASVNPGFIDAYKRLIAVDIAYAYVTNILRTASQIMANLQNGSASSDAQNALQQLNERVTMLMGNLQKSRLEEYAKTQQQAELERQMQLMHQAMVAGIPAQAFTSMTVFGEGR